MYLVKAMCMHAGLLIIFFDWTHRSLTSGVSFSLALALSVGIYSHEPSSFFHHNV